MSFYPVMLDLRGKDCLVIGGGRIALRKVIGLLRADALVTVVASGFISHFKFMAHRINLINRCFSENDIQKKYALVIGATDQPSINHIIFSKAAELGILCNIVDQPQLCSFIVPAVINRGNITIAVSTNAASPRLSRYVKNEVAKAIGPQYVQIASYMKELRIQVRTILSNPQHRCLFWKELFEIDILGYINSNGWENFCERTDRLVDKFKQKAGIV